MPPKGSKPLFEKNKLLRQFRKNQKELSGMEVKLEEQVRTILKKNEEIIEKKRE